MASRLVDDLTLQAVRDALPLLGLSDEAAYAATHAAMCVRGRALLDAACAAYDGSDDLAAEYLDAIHRQMDGLCPCGPCADDPAARAAYRARGIILSARGQFGGPSRLYVVRAVLAALGALAADDPAVTDLIVSIIAASPAPLRRWPLRLGRVGPGTSSRETLRPGKRRPPRRIDPQRTRAHSTVIRAPRAPDAAAL